MTPRIGIATGLFLMIIGAILRLNSHNLAWPQAQAIAWSSLTRAQDVFPYGFEEIALSEIAIVIMAFGGLLTLLSIHWCWRREAISHSKILPPF